jgi:hypothetical protein
MLDEADALIVRRMDHQDAQAAEIAQDLDRHPIAP